MSEQLQGEQAPNDEIQAEYAKLVSQMQCGRCSKLMEPPIYTSVYRHSQFGNLCGKCYDNLSRQIDYARAFNLEVLVERIHSYPCGYKGCESIMKLAARKEHQRSCKMREVKCPFCTWNGVLNGFQGHAKSVHPFSVISQKESEEQGVPFALNTMEKGQVQSFLQFFDGKVFKISCTRKDNQFSSVLPGLFDTAALGRSTLESYMLLLEAFEKKMFGSNCANVKFFLWIQCYGLNSELEQYKSTFLLESNGWRIEKEALVTNDLLEEPSLDSMSLDKGLLQGIGVSPDKTTLIKFKIVKKRDNVQINGNQIVEHNQAAAS